MAQVGALYVDVGLRGLAQAMAGLRGLGERLRGVGEAARAGLAGALRGAVSGIASGTSGAATAIGTITTAAAGATAGLAAMAAAGTYALAQLGRDELAGENLRRVTAAFDGLMQRIRQITLMVGELIATQTGLADGLDWVTQTLGRLWDEWRPTIAAMIDTAITLFSAMWDAAKSAFDLIRSAVSGLMDYFGVSLRGSGETWAQTVKRWAEEVQFFVETFRLRLEILWERWRLFVANSIERIRAFGQNVVVLVRWVGDNWREIFQTIGNYIVTVFQNAGENIRRIWSSVIDWIRGRGWRPPDLRPLTEGFRSAIREMPEWVEANTRESTERLDQLLGELERRREAFRERITARDQRIAQQQLLGTPRRAEPQQIGLVGFADLARRSQEDTLRRLAERQAGATERAAAGIMELAEAARGPGLRVRGMGGARFE